MPTMSELIAVQRTPSPSSDLIHRYNHHEHFKQVHNTPMVDVSEKDFRQMLNHIYEHPDINGNPLYHYIPTLQRGGDWKAAPDAFKAQTCLQNFMDHLGVSNGACQVDPQKTNSTGAPTYRFTLSIKGLSGDYPPSDFDHQYLPIMLEAIGSLFPKVDFATEQSSIKANAGHTRTRDELKYSFTATPEEIFSAIERNDTYRKLCVSDAYHNEKIRLGAKQLATLDAFEKQLWPNIRITTQNGSETPVYSPIPEKRGIRLFNTAQEHSLPEAKPEQKLDLLLASFLQSSIGTDGLSISSKHTASHSFFAKDQVFTFTLRAAGNTDCNPLTKRDNEPAEWLQEGYKTTQKEVGKKLTRIFGTHYVGTDANDSAPGHLSDRHSTQEVTWKISGTFDELLAAIVQSRMIDDFCPSNFSMSKPKVMGI